MYLTVAEFREYKTEIDRRFESVDSDLREIKSEVSGIYTFIRDTMEEYHKKTTDEMNRIAGTIIEEFTERVKVVGEKSDMNRQYCLDENVEIYHNMSETQIRIKQLEEEFWSFKLLFAKEPRSRPKRM